MLLAPATLRLLGFCVAAETVQQLGFRLGAARGRPATQPLVWLGAALWVVEAIAWVQVLQRAPLSLAFPVMSLTYVAVPLAGVLLLRETPSPRQLLGGGLVALGAICVATGGA
jgi:undecaprenyl phosphate-alpha-L-ara4N flippase subunit ArnE